MTLMLTFHSAPRERPPGKRNDKLLATLYNKERYVVYYRNLQQYIQHGLYMKKFIEYYDSHNPHE